MDTFRIGGSRAFGDTVRIYGTVNPYSRNFGIGCRARRLCFTQARIGAAMPHSLHLNRHNLGRSMVERIAIWSHLRAPVGESQLEKQESAYSC